MTKFIVLSPRAILRMLSVWQNFRYAHVRIPSLALNSDTCLQEEYDCLKKLVSAQV
jgi:hypothetical protein